MKTKIRNSISGLFVIPLVLVCFALLPSVQATPDPGSVFGNNTADGSGALQNPALSGTGNTAFGSQALTALTTGDNNNAQGNAALQALTTGGGNAGIGSLAAQHLTIGIHNTAVGNTALQAATTGNRNTAVGYGTLRSGNFSNNTAVGWTAALATTSGANNIVAVGSEALRHNTSGSGTAIGIQALRDQLTGSNIAVGAFAMSGSDDSVNNVAVGVSALDSAVTGDNNTAIGNITLQNVTTGDNNIALGRASGSAFSTASNSVAIGLPGANESGRTWIRNANVIQSFSAGVNNYVTVRVSDGRIGMTAIVSSRRYKDNIKPMENVSDAILKLKPVTFHVKKEWDTTQLPGFGLIAEDVEAVNPDLVYHNEKGEPESVRYDAINAMLLNEFLKEHKRVEEQQASIAQLRSTVAEQRKEMEGLTAQLREQASQIQRVSAQFEAIKPAPRTVANK